MKARDIIDVFEKGAQEAQTNPNAARETLASLCGRLENLASRGDADARRLNNAIARLLGRNDWIIPADRRDEPLNVETF